jgi:DNA-binding transcriptional LysR family regulator
MHNISIDLRRLVFFLTVAEELHFRRAAKRLHMTQPPLSMAIRGLEEDLGVQLLERTTRSVELTRAGSRLFERGQAILEELRQLETEVQQVARGVRGRLHIGFVGIAMWMGIPEVIRDFRGVFPDVHLRLDEMPSARLQEETLAGRVDIGLVRALNVPDPRLTHCLITEEDYWLAIPEHHPLAERTQVPLSALDGQDLLFFPRRFGPLIYDRWLALFAQERLAPRLIQEARSFHAEMALVVAGVGLCLVTASVTRDPRSGVVYRKLDGPAPKVRVFAVWNGQREHALRARFLEQLQAVTT